MQPLCVYCVCSAWEAMYWLSNMYVCILFCTCYTYVLSCSYCSDLCTPPVPHCGGADGRSPTQLHVTCWNSVYHTSGPGGWTWVSTFMSTKECDHHHLLRHTYVCTYVHTYSVHCVCTHLVTEQQPQQELILFMSTLATPLTYLPHSFLFTFSLNHSYVPTLYIAHIHISPACLLSIVSPLPSPCRWWLWSARWWNCHLP